MNAQEKASNIRGMMRELILFASTNDCPYDISAKDGSGKVYKRYMVTIDVRVDTEPDPIAPKQEPLPGTGKAGTE